MLVPQHEMGVLVMVEVNVILPVISGMAILALGTKNPLVGLGVILAVTLDALGRRILVLVVDMTFLALHIDVLALQIEIRL